jgi:hypothetical protein
MCTVCDEFGGLGCPACEKKPSRTEEFHCRWCGRDFPEEEDEEVIYKGKSYCRECYEIEKEEDEALAAEFLSDSAVFQAIKLF